jgi:hypothetical protein
MRAHFRIDPMTHLLPQMAVRDAWKAQTDIEFTGTAIEDEMGFP